MSKPRKRIYLINRDFQLRYAMSAVAVGTMSAILTAAVLLYPLYQFEILRIPRFLPLPILMVMSAAVIINISAVGLIGVFITHRIAGPMYSLVRHFRKVEMGLWAGHLRIREGDDLRYLVRNFNLMVDGLVNACRADLSLVQAALSDVEKVSGATDDAKQKLQELRDRIEVRLRDTQVIDGVRSRHD